jgi:hypothetical protein
MNLEQIVKETVAKIVDEKKLTSAEKKKKEDIVMAMKKTFKGPEPVMHAIATKNAKELAEDFDFVRSAIESASGDKLKPGNDIDDYDRPVYFSNTDEFTSYYIGMGGEFEGNIYKYNAKTGETAMMGNLKYYGTVQNHPVDDDMHESQQELDEYVIRRWQHYAGIK